MIRHQEELVNIEADEGTNHNYIEQTRRDYSHIKMGATQNSA